MIQVWVYDENGYLIGDDFVDKVVDGMTLTPPNGLGLYCKKWDGEKWVEGWTQEEIQAWEDKQNNICPEPTDKERITKLEEEKSILAENVYQLATILEVMLGGTTDGQTETTTTDTTN